MANPTGKTEQADAGRLQAAHRRRAGHDDQRWLPRHQLRAFARRGPRGLPRVDAQRIPRRAAAADGQRLCHPDRPQYDSRRFRRRLDDRLFDGAAPGKSARRGLQARRLRHRDRNPHPSRPHERPSGHGRKAGLPARGSDRARGRDLRSGRTRAFATAGRPPRRPISIPPTGSSKPIAKGFGRVEAELSCPA